MYMLQGKIAYAVIGRKNLDEECEEQRAAKLDDILGKMGKIVLILDDLWEPFMLDKVGIPIGENNCQIILSTRSLEVCQRMGCQNEFVVKVEPLSKSEALKLFVDKLQTYEALATEVKQIARLVAEECGCLPLAIITIAASMRGVFELSEWSNALSELKDPSQRQQDIEEIFDKLKFSYNRLNDVLMRHCFLSCVLYPEDYKILRDDPIDLWITEGLLDGIEGRHEQMNKGHTILNKLENLCLLESTTNWDKDQCVKMHDLIRGMGIKIMQSHPRFMVKAGLQLEEVPKEEQWSEGLIKVSLIENKVQELPCDISPRCPHLSVLMLKCNPYIKGIPESFFAHMRSLTVLDLSYTGIERVPDSVSNLENLRGLLLEECEKLIYVPSLEKLTNLKVLELPSYSKIPEAPRGMEGLSYLEKISFCCWKKSELNYFNKMMESWQIFPSYHYVLRCDGWQTNLGNIYRDKTVEIIGVEIGQEELNPVIPYTAKRLCMFNCKVKGRGSVEDIWPSFADTTELKWLDIDKCQGLEYIWSEAEQSLSISPQLATLEIIKLCNLPQLKRLIKARRGWCESAAVSASMSQQPVVTFSHLNQLVIRDCPEIKVVFPVELLQHRSLLPNLEWISIGYCKKVEVIFASLSSDRGTNVQVLALPNLEVLELRDLPKLETIYNGLLLCTRLESVEIKGCPLMKEDRLSQSKPLIINCPF